MKTRRALERKISAVDRQFAADLGVLIARDVERVVKAARRQQGFIEFCMSHKDKYLHFPVRIEKRNRPKRGRSGRR